MTEVDPNLAKRNEAIQKRREEEIAKSIDPRSSKGARIEDPPTPESRLAEDTAWMARLPAPPRPFGEQREEDIEAWLRAVSIAAADEAIAALTWCYLPRNWPYGPGMRMRMQHIVGRMLRQLDDDIKSQREVAAKRA